MYFYQCVYQKLCLRCQVPRREGLYEWDMLPIKILKKKKKKEQTIKDKKKTNPTGVCLVVAGRLTQDLTLILSTKNTEQNKTKKRKSKQESIYYKRSGEGFIVKNICCAILPATTSLKMPIVKKTCCVLLPLRFMKSFKMKICCVLLPDSL